MTSEATASETTSQQAMHSKSLVITEWVSSKVDCWLLFFPLLLLTGDSCTLIFTSCVETCIWICQIVLLLTKKPRYDYPGRPSLHAIWDPLLYLYWYMFTIYTSQMCEQCIGVENEIGEQGSNSCLVCSIHSHINSYLFSILNEKNRVDWALLLWMACSLREEK